MIVHHPGPYDPNTGNQACARCGANIFYVNPQTLMTDGVLDPEKVRAAGFSTEVEVVLHPLAFFDVGTPLPEDHERCAAGHAPKTRKLEKTTGSAPVNE